MVNHEVALSMVNGATGEVPAFDVQQQLHEQRTELRVVEQQAPKVEISPDIDVPQLGRMALYGLKITGW